MKESELLQLKSQVDEAKNSLNKLEGQKQLLEKQLLADYKCKTVEDAQKLMDKLNKELETINSSIANDGEELENELEAL